MKNLSRYFKTPLKPIPSSLAIIVLVVALIGFADASFLTLEHYRGEIPPCSLGSIFGCETVLTSSFATIAGVPIALLGAVYYLTMAVGAFAYLEGRREIALRLTLPLAGVGFLFTLVLLSLMAFVIKAWCLYCLVSVLTSTTLFVLAIITFRKYGGESVPVSADESKEAKI